MRNPFRRRTTEGLADSLSATGAAGWGVPYDDPDYRELAGFRRLGDANRAIPAQTLEKARMLSVHAYRVNPMARAIIDTYTAFAVGDAGLSLVCTNPDVEAVARRFWCDPQNTLETNQELLFRSHLIEGETLVELMVGELSGATRIAYVPPEAITSVHLAHGNPLWPSAVQVRQIDADPLRLDLVTIDDVSALRRGNAYLFADWKTVVTDRRGFPFLGPVLDWLDAYDSVLYNLIDRTALARYFVWDVTVNGDQTEVDKFLAARKSTAAPKSGSVEVHNNAVTWEPKFAQVGAAEDTVTASAAMTNLAAGAGLAKHWIAEPEDANRATSMSMAEPVRRRVGGVQKTWLHHMTELVRYAVDQAVAAKRLPATVQTLTKAGDAVNVSPSETVMVRGPEIAATDAQVNASILVSLSTALTTMRAQNLLTEEAARVAARRAWEDYMGIPYDPKLDDAGDVDNIADYIDDEAATGDVVTI